MNKPKHVRKPPRASSSHRRRRVLVVHGRDDLNLLLLKELLRDRLHLKLLLLDDEPALGRTIIEKFEQHAALADFAIVLMTPDDLVEFQETRYRQARPNVYFELGWAYRYLGRSRVCIVVKKGTQMPSDLQGINRLDFEKSVMEVAHQLQSELEFAGIMKFVARAS